MGSLWEAERLIARFSIGNSGIQQSNWTASARYAKLPKE
jgi:hypothetical protein